MPTTPLLILLLTVATYAQTSLQDERDGKTYKTVKIGEQTWMAENLNYNAEGSKCYENKQENCAKYGRLYNWQTAMKSCPAGWHLPSKEEWKILIATASGEKIAGKKLKAKSGWGENGNGSDEYGFSALPGGHGKRSNFFGAVGSSGKWWSSRNGLVEGAYFLGMADFSKNVIYGYLDKTDQITVRCIQDNGLDSAAKPKPTQLPPSSQFNPSVKYMDFTDKRDGKKYKTVKIGTQIWMAENLNYVTKSSMCYNKNPANCDRYGSLYTWKDAKKVCPKGWHLPSDKEFETLAKFAGSEFVAGKKLKAKNGWDDDWEESGNGTDEYGFSALPGGRCYEHLDDCYYAGRNGRWWSATKFIVNHIENRGLNYDNEHFFSTGGDNGDLFSVRCLSD